MLASNWSERCECAALVFERRVSILEPKPPFLGGRQPGVLCTAAGHVEAILLRIDGSLHANGAALKMPGTQIPLFWDEG